jgi:hypothetical protein
MRIICRGLLRTIDSILPAPVLSDRVGRRPGVVRQRPAGDVLEG